jgi:alkaline phosphatase D
MNQVSRRQFLAMAAAMSASAAWAGQKNGQSRIISRERRDLYPEGVASGDPDAHSVLLWTRRHSSTASSVRLTVEVSEDEAFSRVVVRSHTTVSAVSDWTCRVLVGNLEPFRVYWYRFIDAQGNASRVGRTLTAPAEDDARPTRFAFVCCQNVNLGAQHAYRRMIFEDERAPEAEQLGFVLHLGDFIYEMMWYPEDRPQGYYDRRPRDIVRYPQGEKIADFHIPTTLEDYRMVYRAYLHDPDLQDARARWPFVCIWDNHEFSLAGWQSIQVFNGKNRPAQTRKVAANQAWFEYQPARVVKSSGPDLERFDPPKVYDTQIERFDEYGLGDELNNHAALSSLTGYRAFHWGRNVELIITDQRSYRSEEPTGRPEASALTSEDFPELFPQEGLEVLDAGRAYAGGKPPAAIRFGAREIPNFREKDPPQTILGAEQKKWFIQKLKDSSATWKIWGNTVGTLDARSDPQNLPPGLTQTWPGSGYAAIPMGDYATAYLERAEIYAAVRDGHITGFVTVSGNSHSFWAGLATPSLPPQRSQAVGVAFVTGSISSPGFVEYMQHSLSHDHPLRALYLGQRSADAKPEPTFNMLVRHGVRSCLEYQRTGDLKRARSLSNPDLSPHLSFVDLDGNGYAVVLASSDALECEFVCIPRPIERATALDGGPLLYRVVHRTSIWNKGESPQLQQRIVEGNPFLSI